MPLQSVKNKSIPDQALTDYLTAFHELEQRENPPKPPIPEPEKRVSMKELFAENKLFLAVGGLVPLVFFGSMIATQVIATSPLGNQSLAAARISNSHNAGSQVPLSATVKIATASNTMFPSAISPSARPQGTTNIAGKYETVISQKTTASANPYKKIEQPQRTSSPTSQGQASAPVKKMVKPIALPPVVSPPSSPSVSSPPTAKPNGLKELTNNVVNTLEKLKQQESNPNVVAPNTDNLRQAITALVLSATSKGKSNAYVQSLIDDALAGRNAIPTALANADGKLDTQLLLSSVLPKKNAAKVGNTQSSYLNALESESKALIQKKRRKIPVIKKLRYVIVKQGDNLSRIAKQVYGDPLAYVKIYRANQNLLENANILTIGMKLKIPR